MTIYLESMRIVARRAMTGPNYDKHIDSLVNMLQDQVNVLVESHGLYSDAQDAAGTRDWSEMRQWASFANLYARSQLLLIDQMTLKRAKRASLCGVIEYASSHASAFSRRERPERAREDLGRVSIGVFSRDEALADLRKVQAANSAVKALQEIQQPDRSLHAFQARVAEQGGSPERGFRLPDFPEIELAIDAIFELWLKYCEVFIGENFSRVAFMPRSANPEAYAALFGDWSATALAAPKDRSD